MIKLGRAPHLCVLTLALLAACGKKEAPPAAPVPEVGVTEAIQKDVPVTVEMIGQTLGASDIQIRARVRGWLLAMHFQEGSEVKKGALLYTIDSSELDQRVAAAQGSLAAAQANLAQATNDVKRYRPLVEMNAVSKRDLELAEARELAGHGAVDAAKAELDLAKIDLGYAKVVAPIDGLIGISKVRVGDYIGLGESSVLNTVSIVHPIRVRVSISEREYLDISRKLALNVAGREAFKRQDLELRLADGSLHASPGTIDFADRQVDPTTGALLVDAIFPNPQKLVRPGQFARLRAVVEVKKGALLVPQPAVQELQGQYFVYVVGSGGTVENRPVKPGTRQGNLWLIDEGLKPGDRVVVEGTQRVGAGVKVTTKQVAATAGEGAKPGEESAVSSAGH